MMKERRKDAHGEWRMMGEVERYIVARRPSAYPRLFSRKEWDKMSTPEAWDILQDMWDKHMLPAPLPKPPETE